jgi:hypothetical protein
MALNNLALSPSPNIAPCRQGQSADTTLTSITQQEATWLKQTLSSSLFQLKPVRFPKSPLRLILARSRIADDSEQTPDHSRNGVGR